MAELAKLPLVLSWTSWNHYETCPKRFYHMYIAKDAGDKRKYQAQKDGISAHDAIRRRLKLREKLPEQHAKYESACLDIERIPADKQYEWRLAIDKDGRTCEPGDAAARVVGVLDVALMSEHTAYLVDWKSGKVWEDPGELRLHAMLLRARFPRLQKITGSFYWLRETRMGPPHPVVDDTIRTWNELLHSTDSIARRIANSDWPADENNLCPWCDVSKQQCPHRKDPPK